jgi:hypothetical protein
MVSSVEASLLPQPTQRVRAAKSATSISNGYFIICIWLISTCKRKTYRTSTIEPIIGTLDAIFRNAPVFVPGFYLIWATYYPILEELSKFLDSRNIPILRYF